MPWVNPYHLPDGNHQFRLVPQDPKKNPNGIHTYIMHRIQMSVSEDSKVKVLCGHAYGDSCVICDFLLGITEHFASLPTDVVKILTTWGPQNLRLVPTVWRLSSAEDPKTGYNVYTYDPKGELPVLLRLDIGKTSNKSIYEDILKLHGDDPYLSSFEEGSWIDFQKKRATYKLSTTKDQTALETKDEILKRYPDLAKYGFKDQKDPSGMVDVIKETYAYRKVVEHIGDIDFSELV